jgi:hypothetical protein
MNGPGPSVDPSVAASAESDQAVALAAPSVPAPTSRRDHLHEPLLRLYLASLATFGVYLAWRTFVIARSLDVGARVDRRRAVFWAAGVYCPPLAVALLYELPRLVRADSGTLVRRPWPLWAAPSAYGALAFLILVSGWAGAWSVWLAALSLPFLLVQLEVNRWVAAGPTAVPSTRCQSLRWLVLALLPGAVLGLRALDRGRFLAWRSARTLKSGEVIADVDRRFFLRVPSAGWEQVAPGVVGDGREKLAFRERATGHWLLVFDTPVKSTDVCLDDMVENRRAVLASTGTILESAERRRFLPGAKFVPASFANHRVRASTFLGAFVVTAAIIDKHAVEVVGFGSTGRPPEGSSRFVESLRGPEATP